MRALTTLQNMPATESEIKEFAEMLNNEILSGVANPLDVDIILKAIEDTLKLVRKNSDVQYATVNEAQKYGKTFEYKGASITVQSRSTYDYTQCEDSVLDGLLSQAAELKKQIEIRQAQLQSGVDLATGEVLKQPTQKTSEFLAIKFK